MALLITSLEGRKDCKIFGGLIVKQMMQALLLEGCGELLENGSRSLVLVSCC